MGEQIKMQFPARSEYIKAIRLAVSGIASELDFSVDEIEEIKMCVAESCILFLCGQKCSGVDITIRTQDGISVCVEGMDAEAKHDCPDCSGFNEEISRVMIEAMSDEMEILEHDGIFTRVSFVKRVKAH